MKARQRFAFRFGLVLSVVVAVVLALRAVDRPDESTAIDPMPAAEAATVIAQAPTSATASVDPAAGEDSGVALDLDELDEDLVARYLTPDPRTFDQMVELRRIRMLVTYNRTNFFLDRGRARGIVAEAGEQLQNWLNQELGLPVPRLDVVMIPVGRDQLLPYLEQGKADLAVANLTITAERKGRVRFSIPAYRGVSELVVGGPDSPPLTGLDDLSGQTVHVRRSSSYYASLQRLNEDFAARGHPLVQIETVDEVLETEDLLEMVNAGLMPFTVADDYLTRLWSEVLVDLQVYPDIAVARDQNLGWAMRKEDDELADWINRFLKLNRKGTLTGNVLFNRYFRSTKYIDRATAGSDRERFEELIDLFKRYGGEYGFDYLMVAAQGYQESRLDQNARSSAGAVGIMQIKPSTAADPAVGIPDIEDKENNIHAGIRYLRHIEERYFNDPALDELNTTLFCFAAYNMGPTRMRRIRSKAADLGFDANVWFGEVERVVADEVGREPVRYVRNIYKYYTAYKLLEQQGARRQKARSESAF